jgi:DNA-binding beta-propeller fold protein YncE
MVSHTPPPEPAAEFGAAPRLLVKWGSYGEGPGQFIYIPDIEVDRDGDVYAIDSNHCRIQKFSSQGRFLLEWGTCGEQPGQLRNPVGLAVDDLGHVYVADFTRNCIHKFTETGQFLTRWGTSGSGPGQFRGPSGLAVDGDGDIYVTDRFNRRVQQFKNDGKFVAQWGSHGSRPGQFLEPVGIAVDRSNNIYVVDYEIGGVQKFTSRGEFVSSWRTKTQDPRDYTYTFSVAVDAHENVYLCDNHRGQVEEYSGDGKLIRVWIPGCRGVARLVSPSSIAVDENGDVCVVGGSEGESSAIAFIGRFGFGPTAAEQLLSQVFDSMDRVNSLLDTLLAVPIGEPWTVWTIRGSLGQCQERGQDQGPPEHADTWVTRCRDAAPIGSIETRGYIVGFESRPSLEAVSWQMAAGAGASTDLAAVFEALSDVLSRRLGSPVASAIRTKSEGRLHDETRNFALQGGPLRLSLVSTESGERAFGIRIERASLGLVAAESAPPDTSDLRLFEGQPYARETVRRDLIRALSHRPRLAEALQSPPGSLDDLGSVERALDEVSLEASPEEHDLVYLSADAWLASLPQGYDASTVARLHHSLVRFGVRLGREPESGSILYCGSLLPSLASRVGANPWANRAFLLLLDQGWDTTCSDQYEGATFANEVYPPVLKHGEQFLQKNPNSSIWPAVALRVALAHETAWSLSFTSDANDFPDYRIGASEHLERALELNRALVLRVLDPSFARALRSRIRLLEKGVDTHCRVYYLEGGC